MRLLPLLLLLACTGPGGPDKGTEGELPDLLGILITPEDVVVPTGSEIQLTATGLGEDRSSQDVTLLVDWTSTQPGVAEVSDAFDEEGVIRGKSVGSAEITALLGDVESVPLKVKVVDADVEALTLSPGTVSVAVGRSVDVDANVQFSDGNTSDAAGQVRWIIADGAVATVDGGSVTGVAAGTTTLTAEWDGVASNPVTVEVLGAGSEPNLIVEAVSGTGNEDTAVVQVVVRNDGDVGVGEFWVDVFLEPDSPPSVGEYGDGYQQVPYLGPGESTVLYYDAEGLPAGDYEVWAVADSEGSVSESSEADNVESGVLSIDDGGSGGDADLVIEDFDYIADDEQIYYVVAITNLGIGDAPGFYVDLFVDSATKPDVGDEGDEYESVSGLGAFESVEVEFLVDNLCFDPCKSWVLVDSTGEVDEDDESDNTASLYVLE